MATVKEARAVKKVLVVDDERVLTETIGYNLRREGYTTINAYDGPSALVTARANLLLQRAALDYYRGTFGRDSFPER